MSKSVKFYVTVLPCPFCGLAEVSVGVQSALSYGVGCPQCRVVVARQVPDRWPRGVRKRGLTADENLERLYRWTLVRAVFDWNSRSVAAKATRVEARVFIP